MAGYDQRIAVAFAELGYDLFPFQVYNADTLLNFPSSVQVPSQYIETLGRIATAPVWAEIYKTLAALTAPQNDTFMAGIAFVGNDLRLSLFKSMGTVDGSDAAGEWALSYFGTIDETLSQYAGRSHLVDPQWIAMLEQMMNGLSGFGAPADGSQDPGGKAPGGGVPDQPLLGASPIPTASPMQPTATSAGLTSWLQLGLRAVIAVLNAATVRTNIRTTIFWFPPAGRPSVDQATAHAWVPLNREYSQGEARRTVHGIWNPVEQADIPGIWWGGVYPWRGPSVVDMPHDVWQWCKAFFPTRPCGGPGEALTGGSPFVGDTAFQRRFESI